MTSKIAWVTLSLILIITLVLSSCAPEATPTPTSTPTSQPTSTATVTPEAHWWDDMGEPEYGGTITIRQTTLSPTSFDPYEPQGTERGLYAFDYLFIPDLTVDPEVWPFSAGFIPVEYHAGLIAESYEWTDPQTVTVKIREGVTWQNKPPVNGRELTAEDVQYSFDRMMGTGNGFTEPHPWWGGQFSGIEKVVATDTYTVEFQLKTSGAMTIYQILAPEVFNTMVIVPREWVEQGDTQNWENQVGSGPWMVSDFEENVSITYTRNPDYWRYDERHPEYQLPYADSLNVIAITDTSTALAAMKTQQIDMITDTRAGAVSQAQAESLEKTNPEIVQYWSASGGCSLDMRCDQEPFTDITVRKALQMAVDRQLIAEGYFQGKVDGIPCGLLPRSFAQAGWTLPYEEWPEELQHEYSYDPEAAKQLLADAGYPNGFDTAIIVDSADNFLPLVEIVKSQFADIGVNMEIDTMDTGTMRSVGNAGTYEGMALSGRMSFGLVPNIGLGFRLTTSGNNWTRHSDTHFDDLVAAISTATTVEAAKEASTEADMYLLSQHWGVYTLVAPAVTVFQPYLGGYVGENFPMSSRNSFFPTRIWIKQAEKESM